MKFHQDKCIFESYEATATYMNQDNDSPYFSEIEKKFLKTLTNIFISIVFFDRMLEYAYVFTK